MDDHDMRDTRVRTPPVSFPRGTFNILKRDTCFQSLNCRVNSCKRERRSMSLSNITAVVFLTFPFSLVALAATESATSRA